MAARYAQGALRFAFPADWTLIEEEREEWPRFVSLQFPGGGYWTAYHYPAESDRLALMEEVLETIKSEYGEVEIEEREEIIGEAFVDGFDLTFFCLDFLIDCSVRGWETPSGTLIWMVQAQGEEFDDRADAFRDVAEALLSNFAKYAE